MFHLDRNTLDLGRLYFHSGPEYVAAHVHRHSEGFLFARSAAGECCYFDQHRKFKLNSNSFHTRNQTLFDLLIDILQVHLNFPSLPHILHVPFLLASANLAPERFGLEFLLARAKPKTATVTGNSTSQPTTQR